MLFSLDISLNLLYALSTLMKKIGIINKRITPFLTDVLILYPLKKQKSKGVFKDTNGNIRHKWTETIKPFEAPQRSVKIKI